MFGLVLVREKQLRKERTKYSEAMTRIRELELENRRLKKIQGAADDDYLADYIRFGLLRMERPDA